MDDSLKSENDENDEKDLENKETSKGSGAVKKFDLKPYPHGTVLVKTSLSLPEGQIYNYIQLQKEHRWGKEVLLKITKEDRGDV